MIDNYCSKFAKKNNIMFLNVSNRIMNYVNILPDNFDIELLPYLEIDAHMSNVGHYLVAEEIVSLIHEKKNKE